MNWPRWARRAWDRYGPARRLRKISGDTLPNDLPSRDLVLAREGIENVCVGLRCPCGCGYPIQLATFDVARPRWDVVEDEEGRPTLQPSVNLRQGCRSHFWIRKGRVIWCD